ncbi:giant isoform X1 [Leptinotarsa decemlineata]|uniref:giant isoform X1 n=2 Tax=Leptinotarsa decemlineata TaxID=7539 RepID=UPI000C254D0B|nr:cell death specification protein 2-like isoform X2 [Leptinotarsa decemlineata]
MMHSTMMAFSHFPTYLPGMRPINPGHDIQEAPVILDLCTKKRSLSPDFPHDYTPHPSNPTPISPSSPKTDISDVSSSEENNSPLGAKCSRPFKTYPNNPMAVAMASPGLENILGKESAEAYAEFRSRMLSQVQSCHNVTNKNMRRTQSTSTQSADPVYLEKRKKNNEAAKRSRDARRAKEDEIAIRCAFLEQENLQLKCRIAALESDRARLQNMIYK